MAVVSDPVFKPEQVTKNVKTEATGKEISLR